MFVNSLSLENRQRGKRNLHQCTISAKKWILKLANIQNVQIREIGEFELGCLPKEPHTNVRSLFSVIDCRSWLVILLGWYWKISILMYFGWYSHILCSDPSNVAIKDLIKWQKPVMNEVYLSAWQYILLSYMTSMHWNSKLQYELPLESLSAFQFLKKM